MLPRPSEIGASPDGSAAHGALVLAAPAGLDEIWVAAMRADAIDGLVPGDEVAGRVALAAEECATLL